MQLLDPAHGAVFAELVRRCPTVPVRTEDALGGRFVRVPVRGRGYWYFDGPAGTGPRRYVGPQDDPVLAGRVARFADAKADAKARRRLVSSLVRDARLKPPEPVAAAILTALAEAGIFGHGAVLIGRAALASYPALLGVRMPDGSSRLKEGPLALPPPLVLAAEVEMPPILEALRQADPAFRQVPYRIEGRHVTAYQGEGGRRVFALAANHRAAGSMPALAGEPPAQPLRLLDFLIRSPVRTALLHGSGLGVTVPSPERYLIHRLILSSRRRDDDPGARARDVRQADLLVEALSTSRRLADLGAAYAEASVRGDAWRADLMAGVGRLLPSRAAEVRSALTEALHAAAGRERG